MEYRRYPQGLLLRLDRGEELLESLSLACREAGVALASVSGIGAAGDVTLGVFDTREQQYHSRRYQGELEIAALCGSVTRKDGEVYLHLHGTFANPERGLVAAGHLNRAVISATAEVFLTLWDGEAGRRFSPEVGLNLLEFPGEH